MEEEEKKLAEKEKRRRKTEREIEEMWRKHHGENEAD